MSDKVISSTTQEFLDVYDIVNDMVLLKDGTASIILQVGTMNFSLLAEQEQDAIIFTYGSLLNSLNYPIQISVQSQTKDVTKYLKLLDDQIQKASSDRKATLIKQYRDFVAALIKERNVLEKHFYVTIPASAAEMGLITPSSVLPGKSSFNIASFEKSIILEKAINLLEPRRDHLISQFNRLGLYTRQLNTQEIIQNFYINYNPEAVEGQEISSNENYTTPLVRASFGRKNMQTNNAQNPTPEEILSNEPIVAQEATPSIQQATIAPVAIQELPVALKTDISPSLNELSADQTIDVATPVTSENQIKEIYPISSPTIDTQANNIQPVESPSIMPQATSVQTENPQPIEQLAPQPINSVPEINQVEEVAVTPNLSANVDLKLDSNLINSQPGVEPVADQIILDNAPISEDIQTNTEEIQPVLDQQDDFAEEITPIQSNLEPQTAKASVQNNEVSQIMEPQI